MKTPLSRLPVLVAVATALAGATLCVPSALAGSSWQPVTSATALSAHSASASAYDEVSGKMILFGGYDDTSYLNDTWAFDGLTWTKLNTTGSPSPRAASRMAYDSVAKKLVLFGGFNGSAYLGDTWIFDGANNTWTQASPGVSPKAVTAPMMFTDPVNGHAVVYGGYDGHFYQLTTYRWTGTTWQNLNPATSPWARSAGAVALNPVTHKVVLFGGLGSVNPWNTWEWNGTNWAQLNPAQQPDLRYDSAAAYDPHFGGVVLFGGGSGGQQIDDTWLWNGTNWTPITTNSTPGPRESFGMAFVPALNHIVIAGGEDSSQIFSDTWTFLDPGTFTTIGNGTGGALGPPHVFASGDLTPGSLLGAKFDFINTQPNAPGVIFLGTTQVSLPFDGGFLYTLPIQFALPIATNAQGKLSLTAPIPVGVPSGASFILQGWFQDNTSIFHVGSTNGILATVP